MRPLISFMILKPSRRLPQSVSSDRDVGRVEAAGAAKAVGRAHRDALDLAIADHRHQARLDLVDILLHVFVGGAFRSGDVDLELAAILQRRVFRRDLRVDPVAARDQHDRADGDRDRPRHGGVEGLAIGVAQPAEEAVHVIGETMRLLVGVVFARLQQLGRQHRRQRQGDQHREGDGGRDGDGEFREQPAHLALHEGDRHEHGDQHQRGRENGEADLARAAIGGDERRLAFFLDPAVDVLEHHDGVIDHEADRHDEGEQGEHVDRQAEGVEHAEGRDQADRHGHGRHHGGAQAAEEQEDHADDQRDGDGERLLDFFHRGRDEHRAVLGDGKMHVGRQRLGDLGRALAHLFGDLHDVGGGLLDDADAEHRRAVAAERVAIFLGAILDPGDVAEVDDDAVGRALGDHQVGEVGRGLEGAVEARGEDEVLGLEAARRRLDVFRQHGALQVGGGKAARRHGAPVEPDAHGGCARAAFADAGDAVDRGEAVFEIALGEIGQFDRRALVAGQRQEHHRLFAGVGFLDVWRIGVFRQAAQEARHAGRARRWRRCRDRARCRTRSGSRKCRPARSS